MYFEPINIRTYVYKEYFNCYNCYGDNMKKRIFATITLFVITLASGCLLIKQGIEKAEETKIKIQEEKNNKNIKKLENKNAALIIQENELKLELKAEEKQNGTSDKYYEINNKIKKISEEKTKIEFEISKIKNGYYNNQSGLNESVASGLIYIFPGIVLCISSFIILITRIKKFK